MDGSDHHHTAEEEALAMGLDGTWLLESYSLGDQLQTAPENNGTEYGFRWPSITSPDRTLEAQNPAAQGQESRQVGRGSDNEAPQAVGVSRSRWVTSSPPDSSPNPFQRRLRWSENPSAQYNEFAEAVANSPADWDPGAQSSDTSPNNSPDTVAQSPSSTLPARFQIPAQPAVTHGHFHQGQFVPGARGPNTALSRTIGASSADVNLPRHRPTPSLFMSLDPAHPTGPFRQFHQEQSHRGPLLQGQSVPRGRTPLPRTIGDSSADPNLRPHASNTSSSSSLNPVQPAAQHGQFHHGARGLERSLCQNTGAFLADFSLRPFSMPNTSSTLPLRPAGPAAQHRQSLEAVRGYGGSLPQAGGTAMDDWGFRSRNPIAFPNQPSGTVNGTAQRRQSPQAPTAIVDPFDPWPPAPRYPRSARTGGWGVLGNSRPEAFRISSEIVNSVHASYGTGPSPGRRVLGSQQGGGGASASSLYQSDAISPQGWTESPNGPDISFEQSPTLTAVVDSPNRLIDSSPGPACPARRQLPHADHRRVPSRPAAQLRPVNYRPQSVEEETEEAGPADQAGSAAPRPRKRSSEERPAGGYDLGPKKPKSDDSPGRDF